MKVKKLLALVMTCAVAATATSILAACDKTPEFVEDTNIWYAVGNDSKGTCKVNNWQPQTINDELKFKRDTTVTNENVFTLTLDIYAGNVSSGLSFKFLYKTSADEVISDTDLWARQIGINQFEGVEGEGKDAVVKDGDNVIFTTGDGADANNLALAKGQDGTYTFTMKTFPGQKKDPVITFKKDKEIPITHDMWVYGDINNFGWGATANNWPLTENVSGDDITWKGQITVTAEDAKRDNTGAVVTEGGQYAAVQLYNKINNSTYVLEDAKDYPIVEIANAYTDEKIDKHFNLLPVGGYTIEYNQKTNAISLVQATHEMYFIGSVNGWSEDVKPEFKLTESADKATWTGTLVVEEKAEIKLFNALNGEYYTTAAANGGNITLEPGAYFFKFTVEGNVVEYDEATFHIVGTFVDGDENVNFSLKDGVTPVMIATDTAGVVSASVNITDVTGKQGYEWIAKQGSVAGVESAIFAFKPVFVSELAGGIVWSGAPSANNYVAAAGTYTITYNMFTQAITATLAS